jgi:hypothetical protein
MPKYTAKLDAVLPVREIRNIPVSGPTSEAEASGAVTVTTGKQSAGSSAIVTVALLGLPTVYAGFGVSIRVAPSLPSQPVSAFGVKGISTYVKPTGIVTGLVIVL